MLYFDYKIFFAVLATLIATASYVPYIRAMRAGAAKPHPYTWLVWTITQSIAAAGVWVSANIWVAISMWIVSGCVFGIFLFSLKYGTKKISLFDSICLISAAASLGAWFLVDQKLTAVLIATAIDWIGYLPTVRKTWSSPTSETPIVWFGFMLATGLSLLALHSYSLINTAHLAMSLSMNLLVLTISLRR